MEEGDNHWKREPGDKALLLLFFSFFFFFFLLSYCREDNIQQSLLITTSSGGLYATDSDAFVSIDYSLLLTKLRCMDFQKLVSTGWAVTELIE